MACARLPQGGPMITVKSLTKRYGRITAVDSLTFEVAPGTVTGFLGPNGSGKSTTMRMIMGLDAPDAGQARIGGRAYRELRWPLREVGSQLEARSFHPGRSARAPSGRAGRQQRHPARPGRRGARDRRAGRGGRPAGGEVLARHGPAARRGGRAARRSRRAAARRAGQRPGPRGHPLDQAATAVHGRRGPHDLRLQPPDQRDGADGRGTGGDRARPPARADDRTRAPRRVGVAGGSVPAAH